MSLFELLRDASARIARAQEALEDGEKALAWEILHDLELDVERVLGEYARAA